MGLLSEGLQPAVPELKFKGLVRQGKRRRKPMTQHQREAFIRLDKKQRKKRKAKRRMQNASRRANRVYAR